MSLTPANLRYNHLNLIITNQNYIQQLVLLYFVSTRGTQRTGGPCSLPSQVIVNFVVLLIRMFRNFFNDETNE